MEAGVARSGLRNDFRRRFHGELHDDPAVRRLYAVDAGLFQIEPMAVAVPADADDVSFLHAYCRERAIPLIPRGAGTGLAGESLGSGIVVDLSPSFRTIGEVGADTVRVQPGVVLNLLNEQLARHGRRIGPDPASARSCTIGGMVATDASGGRAARHGSMRDHVVRLSMVWDDGSTDWIDGPNTGRPTSTSTPPTQPTPPTSLEQQTLPMAAPSPSPRMGEILGGLQSVRINHGDAVRAVPVRSPFDRCGYALQKALIGETIDLRHLIAGSEGTLGTIVDVELRTIPLPGGRSGVLFGFARFEAALSAATIVRQTAPSACEIMDRRLISLARVQSTEAARLIPGDTEAIMLVEYERETPTEAVEAVEEIVDRLQFRHQLALSAVAARDGSACDDLWRIRESALPSLYALGKGARPVAFVEDIGLPVDTVADFLGPAHVILRKHDTIASVLIHSLTGQLHIRPFLDLDRPEDAAKLWPIAEQLHGLAIDMGGTVSSQHGVGVARTPWVERQLGAIYPVHRLVKQIFDPIGILNPGKITGIDPGRPAWPLRSTLAVARKGDDPTSERPVETNATASTLNEPSPTSSLRRVALPTVLQWQPGEMDRAISACNGCGSCRTQDSDRRMCPVFRADPAEAASPRAKVNLFAAVHQSPDRFKPEEIRRVADLCVNCRMCARECPGKADIPTLMLEAKAAVHAEHGQSRFDAFLARIDGWAGTAAKFPLTANLLLGRPLFRWVLEKAVGLSRSRRLPSFAFRSFLRRAKRRKWTNRPENPGVALFVDTFVNRCRPAVAEAAYLVLRHLGIPVTVPFRQTGSGMAALAMGDLDSARDRLAYNLRSLAPLARSGYRIVCIEPSSALFFKRDAERISVDPDTAVVARQTVELTAYLAELKQDGRLRNDFQAVSAAIGHHVPCHVKALEEGVHGPELLSLIPGIESSIIDDGCSGMAGAWGLSARNHQTSRRAGSRLAERLDSPAVVFGSSECSSCRLQMEELSGKRAWHPVQYLAMAYGLTPNGAEELRRPLSGRVSS